MNLIQEIEYQQHVAECNVLFAELDCFDKLQQITECYGVINYDNMFIQEGAIKSAFGAIGNVFKNEKGKVTLKSIVKGFIRLCISGWKSILQKLQSIKYSIQLKSSRCTHVTVAFDLDEMINIMTNIAYYIKHTDDFYKEFFGQAKNGGIAAISGKHDIEKFSEITSYKNRNRLASQSFNDMMAKGDIEQFSRMIDENLTPWLMKSQTTMGKLSKVMNSAKQEINQMNQDGLTKEALDEYKQKILAKNPNADLSHIQLDVDPNHIGSDHKKFTYRYKKEDAVSKFKHLNQLTLNMANASSSIYQSLKMTYDTLNAVSDRSEFTDERDDTMGSDSAKIVKVIKPVIDNMKSIMNALVDYSVFSKDKYGVFWLTDYSPAKE